MIQLNRPIDANDDFNFRKLVTIPDAVLIKFNLLMMSTTLLETCRGL